MSKTVNNKKRVTCDEDDTVNVIHTSVFKTIAILSFNHMKINFKDKKRS